MMLIAVDAVTDKAIIHLLGSTVCWAWMTVSPVIATKDRTKKERTRLRFLLLCLRLSFIPCSALLRPASASGTVLRPASPSWTVLLRPVSTSWSVLCPFKLASASWSALPSASACNSVCFLTGLGCPHLFCSSHVARAFCLFAINLSQFCKMTLW